MPRNVSTEADLGAIRHPIDLDKLTQFLIESCPSDFAPPLALKQFGFGQSNPSYQITDSKGRRYVLRKQPPGELLSKSAHRVDREFEMQKALSTHSDIPVAKMFVLCTDKSIIGTMFYVMEFFDGRIFHETSFEGVTPKERGELWLSVLSTLARLHAVDPAKIGLPGSMTRNMSSHYPRQLKTLKAVVDAQAKALDKTTGKELGPIKNYDAVLEWMKANIPDNKVSIVHGDFKIDNLVFHKTQNKVIGILDWELCTIGHPLADLGNLLIPYEMPDLPGAGALSLKREPGLPTLEENLANYAKFSGYDASKDWDFAVVYALMRYAMITHGIAARVLQGQASSANAKKMGSVYPLFVQLAYSRVSDDPKL